MNTLEKQSLFWDVDLKTLDADKHRDFIGRRVLSMGDVDDLAWTRNKYGTEYLIDLFCRSSDELDAKSRNFWKCYFQLSDKALCTPKPSNRRRSAFSMRSSAPE